MVQETCSDVLAEPEITLGFIEYLLNNEGSFRKYNPGIRHIIVSCLLNNKVQGCVDASELEEYVSGLKMGKTYQFFKGSDFNISR
ncbi:hypothetical protein KY358_02915 [Candidatus Woesearchaeota archaeon]|nr:hypothetical protein [Candidatus Woesearchaeota archaeon]